MSDILHFSHANGFPAGSYRVLLEALAAHYDVRTIDKLAHNPAFPVTDNWHHLALELEHFFEQHYHKPVIAVGHSLGGVLSMMVARKRPDLVKALVMLDAPALTPLQSFGLKMAKQLGLVDKITPAGRTDGRRTEWASLQEARDYFSGKTLMKAFDTRCLTDYVNAGTETCERGVRLRFDAATEMKIYRTIPHNLNVSGPLPQPAAAIGGRSSKVFTRMTGAYMQGRLGMKVHWLEGTHMFPLEQPEQTAEAVQMLCRQMLHDH